MKKLNNIDDAIFANSSVDDLMIKKLNIEAQKELEAASNPNSLQPVSVVEFSKLPAKFIFSKFACYKVFNRKNKTENFINGIQAESFLGTSKNLRFKLINREISSFATDDVFVRFHCASIPYDLFHENL